MIIRIWLKQVRDEQRCVLDEEEDEDEDEDEDEEDSLLTS